MEISDEEILNISNKFLFDYEINLDNYCHGEVQKSWLKNYLLKILKMFKEMKGM